MDKEYIESPKWDYRMIDILHKFFLDYYCNYLTVERIAEDHGINSTVASSLIDEGRRIHGQRSE